MDLLLNRITRYACLIIDFRDIARATRFKVEPMLLQRLCYAGVWPIARACRQRQQAMEVQIAADVFRKRNSDGPRVRWCTRPCAPQIVIINSRKPTFEPKPGPVKPGIPG